MVRRRYSPRTADHMAGALAQHDAATFNEPTRADDQPGLITFDAPTLAEAFGWLDEKTETWLFPSDEFIEGDFYLWTCELREGA